MSTPNLAFAVFNGLWPVHADTEHGPRALYYPVTFTAASASVEVNLSEEEMMAQLKFVQSLYIDNGDNGAALTVTIQMTQQRIKVKANTQGYYPVLVPNSAKLTFSLAAAAPLVVPVQFINVPLPAIQWATV
jgi:hypothetical protein